MTNKSIDMAKIFHLLVALHSCYMFITLCLHNCILWNMENGRLESFLDSSNSSPLETPTIFST